MNNSTHNSLYLLLGLFLGIIFLFLSEIHWRHFGHICSQEDNFYLWSRQRKILDKSDNHNTIVLIGASRVCSGIVPNILEKEFPSKKVINLAISGSQPTETLKDLGNDSLFNGIVICEYITGMFFMKQLRSQKNFVNYYHKIFNQVSNLDENINNYCTMEIRDNIVLGNPHISLYKLFYKGFFIKPYFSVIKRNRYNPLYFRKNISKENLTKYVATSMTWLTKKYQQIDNIDLSNFQKFITLQILPSVQKIQKRGGLVIFVRMPTTGLHWNYDETIFPKSLYWNKLGNLTNAKTIHFKDYSQLSSFNCPDNSHLDASDAPKFTHELSNILKTEIFNN